MPKHFGGAAFAHRGASGEGWWRLVEAGGVEAIQGFSPTFANMRFRAVFIGDYAHTLFHQKVALDAPKRTKTKKLCPELSRTSMPAGPRQEMQIATGHRWRDRRSASSALMRIPSIRSWRFRKLRATWNCLVSVNVVGLMPWSGGGPAGGGPTLPSIWRRSLASGLLAPPVARRGAVCPWGMGRPFRAIRALQSLCFSRTGKIGEEC